MLRRRYTSTCFFVGGGEVVFGTSDYTVWHNAKDIASFTPVSTMSLRERCYSNFDPTRWTCVSYVFRSFPRYFDWVSWFKFYWRKLETNKVCRCKNFKIRLTQLEWKQLLRKALRTWHLSRIKNALLSVSRAFSLTVFSFLNLQWWWPYYCSSYKAFQVWLYDQTLIV